MNHSIKPLTALACLAGAWPLAAQTAPADSAKKPDEVVEFSPFTVSASASSAGRYTSLESISAGRVRLGIMDSSQSVSVITAEMLQDVAGGRILDVAKYVAGVSEATLPNSWERTNVRGFQGDGRTVDGITYAGFRGGNQLLDPAIVERIEIVKGPNFILAPQPASPGGTLNNATKKPQFRDFGLLSLQGGRFDANSGFIDVNRVAGDKLAVRVVASLRDWDNWWKGSYVRATTIMPGFTYQLAKEAQVTVQYTYTDWKAQNYFGLPVDPTSGTTTPAHILAGVPRDLDVFADDAYRATRQHDFKLFFTAELWPDIQMRLVAAYNTGVNDGPQINIGPSTKGFGGNVDPLTGFWNSGLQYAATSPYASSPLAAQPTRVFVRSGVDLRYDPRQFDLQNDYAYIHENSFLKSTTLAGFAFSEVRDNNSTAYNLTAPAFDIDHYVDTPWTQGGLNYSNRVSYRFAQGYLSENLALLGNRLILNVAEAWQHYRQHVESALSPVSASRSPRTALPSYGIVLKPCGEAVSLYYSATEQSSATDGPSGGVMVLPLSNARQKEFGARLKVWENKLYFTVAHFSIQQVNFAAPNPGNLTTPPPNPLLPPLFSNRHAEGWEYELRANPTKSLSLVGSYTRFKNRDQYGVEYRGVAEKAGGLLASYTFAKENFPKLEGVRLAVGVDYLGNRPGDSPLTPFTIASTPDHVILNQPSYYLGSRTLVNLTLAYDSRHHWGVQANVDNLLNREYLLAGVNRNVFPGMPRNLRVSLRYGF